VPAEASSHEALATSMLAQLGQPGARWLHARDGREHHLFRVQLSDGERMLKVPRADGIADPYDPGRTAVARLVAEGFAIGLSRGLPVPGQYRVHATTPPCATMEVLPGTTAEQALERGALDGESLSRVCLGMGRALATLHSVKRPAGGAGIPDLAGADPASARLLHLDFHLGNVLGRPHLAAGWEITGVVDWTCARWGPPEADFVEMQVSVFVRNPRARDAFVAGYRQVSGRAVDLAEVEWRSAAEIRRRLAEQPDEVGELRGYWEAWADRVENPA
jgi:Ser/Thr protein kinase RdoA (MazF antagonist)